MSKASNENSTLPLVIVNPASGSTRDKWPAMASDLRADFGPYRVAFTKSGGDAIAIAKRAAEGGTQFIIACGGDGTINEVGNGILQSGEDCELGVLPSGTGGDFRRSLKIPAGSREAAAALRDGETKRIDAGKVTFENFEGERESRYFFNVSSFGLAASIIDRVKSNKALDWLPLGNVRGRANFALSTLQEIVSLDHSLVNISFDGGEPKPLQTVNFCIANARYFGGGMMIAPDAKLDDGLLDAVNIGDITSAKIILKAYMLYNGTHLSLAEVKQKHVRRVDASPVNDGVEIRIETDGELPGRLPATYEVVPSALRVRVPKV